MHDGMLYDPIQGQGRECLKATRGVNRLSHTWLIFLKYRDIGFGFGFSTRTSSVLLLVNCPYWGDLRYTCDIMTVSPPSVQQFETVSCLW